MVMRIIVLYVVAPTAELAPPSYLRTRASARRHTSLANTVRGKKVFGALLVLILSDAAVSSAPVCRVVVVWLWHVGDSHNQRSTA
jgi:hypothetical protein